MNPYRESTGRTQRLGALNRSALKKDSIIRITICIVFLVFALFFVDHLWHRAPANHAAMMKERGRAAAARAHIDNHKYSRNNRLYFSHVESAGCFHCVELFPSVQINEWTDLQNPEGQHTALCPKCGVDSVLADGVLYKLTPELLNRMKIHWFRDQNAEQNGIP